MSELAEIAQRLADRRLMNVSKKTGINPLTLAMIRDGKTTNPHYKTIEKLKQYFQENP